MDNNDITPALPPNWWEIAKRRFAEGDGWVVVWSDLTGVKNEYGDVAAALALYGQPFGFTHEDVAALRRIEEIAQLEVPGLAERIAALLPPRGT